MFTRRDFVATATTAIGSVTLTPAVQATSEPDRENGDRDTTFAFDDLHAVRDASELAEDVHDVYTGRMTGSIDRFGLDEDDLLGLTTGPGYTVATGTFDAVEIRLELLFGDYDRVDDYAGYAVYDGEKNAVAFDDGELFVVSGPLTDVEGLQTVIDTALDRDDEASPTADGPGSSSKSTPLADADGSIEPLFPAIDDAHVVRGRRLEPGEVPGGCDATAEARRFDGSETIERRVFAFDRPGAIPIPAIEKYVADTNQVPDEESLRVTAEDRIAIAEWVVETAALERVVPN